MDYILFRTAHAAVAQATETALRLEQENRTLREVIRKAHRVIDELTGTTPGVRNLQREIQDVLKGAS